MVSFNAILEYRKAYPDDNCFIGEPDDRVLICANDKYYRGQRDGDDTAFLDRIERSRNKMHNFFYDEYETFKPQSDAIY